MTKRILILPAAVVTLSLAGCGARESNELAVINGETITLAQFHRHLESKPTVNVRLATGEVGPARVNDTLAFQGLTDLLRQRMILQMARDYAVAPTDEDITAELDFRIQRDPRFVENLKALGVNLGQIRESLEVDLARERLLTRTITVTDAEVDRFIQENPREFEQPARIRALWIFLRDETLKGTVDGELAAGQGFAAVASRYSQFRNPDLPPGTFPQDVEQNIPEPIRSHLRATRENGTTEWVQLSDGWAKFFVQSKTPVTKVTIDDSMRKALKRQLASQRGMRANDLDRWLTERLKASADNIEIKSSDLENPWKRAIERLKEADEDLGAPGGAAASVGVGTAPPPTPLPGKGG